MVWKNRVMIAIFVQENDWKPTASLKLGFGCLSVRESNSMPPSWSVTPTTYYVEATISLKNTPFPLLCNSYLFSILFSSFFRFTPLLPLFFLLHFLIFYKILLISWLVKVCLNLYLKSIRTELHKIKSMFGLILLTN